MFHIKHDIHVSLFKIFLENILIYERCVRVGIDFRIYPERICFDPLLSRVFKINPARWGKFSFISNPLLFSNYNKPRT